MEDDLGRPGALGVKNKNKSENKSVFPQVILGTHVTIRRYSVFLIK